MNKEELRNQLLVNVAAGMAKDVQIQNVRIAAEVVLQFTNELMLLLESEENEGK